MAMDPTKKKAIIYSVIFVCVAGLIIGLANLIAHVTKTNQHNQLKYGDYKIKMVGWEGTQGQMFVKWAKETLPELNRLGPSFQLVDSGENISVVKADIVDNHNQCTEKAGLAFQTDPVSGQRRIIIDTVCVQGELEFKTAFMHEVCHSLGMNHVCRASDQRSDCSSVGRGIAIMNPNLVYESNDMTIDNSDTTRSMPTTTLQELDFKEFCRVKDCGKR